MDNIRAAVTWSLGITTPEWDARAARIVFGFRALWHMTLQIAEHRRWVEAIRERLDAQRYPREVGQLLHACLLRPSGDDSIVPMIESATELYERVGDPRAIAALQSTLTGIFSMLGRLAEADAAADSAEALMTQEHLRDSMIYAGFLSNRSTLRSAQGRLEEARADIVTATAIARREDPYFVVSICLSSLFTVEFDLGDFRSVVDICEEMLASEFGTMPEVAIGALDMLIVVNLELGEVDDAIEAARSFLEVTNINTTPWHHIGAIAVLSGNLEAASRLAGFIDARDQRDLLFRDRFEERSHKRLLDALSELPSGIIEARRREGGLFTREEAVNESVRILDWAPKFKSADSSREIERSNVRFTRT